MTRKKHFWEIRDGNIALFWEGIGKQLRPLTTYQAYIQLKNQPIIRNKKVILDYWKTIVNQEEWRQWLDRDQWIPQSEDLDRELL